MLLGFFFDSVGFGEWVVLLAVLLVVVGPKRLPALARQLGHFVARLRQMANAFSRELMSMDSPTEAEETKDYGAHADS